MTIKQAIKHNTDRRLAEEQVLSGSSLTAAEPTPDGLGAWEGGTVKGANNWVSLKSRASRTADAKNAPGIEYPSKIEAKHASPAVQRPEAVCSDCEFESSVASSHEHEGFFEDADES